MMTKVTISLPDSVKGFIQQKVEKNGYGTVSEYIRELVRRDQQADVAKANKNIRQEREKEFIWHGAGRDFYDPFPGE